MFARLIVLVGLVAVVGGCSSQLHRVTAKVDSVQVQERTDQGVRVLVTVSAENPNDIPLPIVKAKYEVRLAGAEPFTFTDLPAVTLPAHGSQTITLPAAFASNGAAAGACRVNGDLIYEPPGEVRKLLTEYGVPLPSAGFSSQGNLE